MDVVGALGVEVTRVNLLEVGNHLEHALVAAQLVAEREHDERRVIAEGLEDQFPFAFRVFVKRYLLQAAVHIEPVNVVDGRFLVLRGSKTTSFVREFGLEIHAQFVRRLECRFRRTP